MPNRIRPWIGPNSGGSLTGENWSGPRTSTLRNYDRQWGYHISLRVVGDSTSGATGLVAAGDDGNGNDYTVEAVVTDTEGATGSDPATVTESEDTSDGSAPTLDSFSGSTRTTGPWFRVESDWAVSDDVGDLDTVTTELLDIDGNVLDSELSSVSGFSAGGSREVRGRSSDYDSGQLTVTDTAGNSASASRDIRVGLPYGIGVRSRGQQPKAQ